MPKVVYSYFPLRALGETPRLLMAYGGQEFEDKRIDNDRWPEFKSKAPFGQMPVLEMDGKTYAQSTAISRYFARKFGLSGATLEEDLEIDQIVDFVSDIRSKAAMVCYDKNEETKKARHEEFTNYVYPFLLDILNAVIEKNNGHLALGKLTWADFLFASMFDYIKYMMQCPDLEVKYPNFKKVNDAVYSLPQLQTYLANAPKSEV